MGAKERVEEEVINALRMLPFERQLEIMLSLHDLARKEGQAPEKIPGKVLKLRSVRKQDRAEEE